MANILNKILNKIFGTDIRKSNPSFQDSTTSQAGESTYEHGTGYEERARSDMAAERQINMPLYEVAERAELSQDSLSIDDIGGTRKMKRW